MEKTNKVQRTRLPRLPCAAAIITVGSLETQRGTKQHLLTPHKIINLTQVAVNTSIGDVNAFLDHIVASTNMKCLTPPRALEGECGYLAANLYAR